MKHAWLLCIKKWKVWLQNSMELRTSLKADSLSRLKGGWRWTLDKSICQLVITCSIFALKPLRIDQDPKIRAESPLYNTCQPRTKTQPDAQGPCRTQPDATAANATETIAIDEGNQITCCSTWNAEICRVFLMCSCLLDDQRQRFANPWTLASIWKNITLNQPQKKLLTSQNCINRSLASSCISSFFRGFSIWVVRFS